MRISDWSSDVCSSDLADADEQLAAAVLVEEDDARIELARLREQAIERHGLSRTRRADDREIAEITLVKVEEIRPCRGRLEQGDRIADRKSVVEGKGVSVRVDLGGRRIIKKTKN